jgi:hypothetical protein
VSAAVTPIRATSASAATVLSFEDERDLRIYFALDLPPCPGTPSTFGPMCDRVANSRNPKTTELPSDGVSWTEILDCRLGQHMANVNGAEDAFIAFFDARRCLSRVHTALSRLSDRDHCLLHARYADDDCDLAPLTPAAERENRERASRDQHEAVEETVVSLQREAKDMRAPKTNRDAARVKLATMRRESLDMLQEARVSYARALARQR